MDHLALARRLWRGGIGADDIDWLAMAINMVDAVLGIIFLDKDCRLSPDLAVAYGLND